MKGKKILSAFIALVLIAGIPVAAFADTWDIGIGNITITATGGEQTVSQENGASNVSDSNPVISGSSDTNTVTIDAAKGATANVTLDDVNIDVSDKDKAGISTTGDGNVTIELEGDSNDYFGKGLSGGKLIVYPPTGITYKQDENIIIGNVALYGATSGKAFINGVAGERFCVRNSGAMAVVEGVGDHGCEYMTGGRVVVIGKIGKNFAAGMSGGIAYVLDEDSDIYTRINKEMTGIEKITSKYDVLELKQMIQEHVAATNSVKGKQILDSFTDYLPKFKKIIPHDYNRMQMAIVQMEEKGLNSQQAQIEAFYANARK